ncbi:peptide/nickel transport system permease protein [Sinosporangium album]|uniref:Peptide/nickel transport system permease protein n=1 Tax=Sinosporangium album TaxID=504805 RepID=A0A1G8BIY9_9ACTN|nr:ABC transporter permease [Sinosporangium album]SDH33197.1 peptide/nickel transport system permease protein [Sinosporangium album]
MRQYIIRRLIALPFVMLAVTMLVFVLVRVGGSPIGIYLEPGMTKAEVAALNERFHLDDPLPMQYIYWLRGVLQGDLGWSGAASAPVMEVYPEKWAATIELALAAGVVAVGLGIWLGTFAARRRNKPPDQFARVFSVAGASLPNFWFGLMMLIVFWAWLKWFPNGRYDIALWESIPHPTGLYTVDSLLAGNLTTFLDAIWHLALPSIVLGYVAAAMIVRMMRSSLVDELGRDYVDAARAKGLPERIVIRRHARRNALVPTVTVIGLAVGALLEGAVVVETIFQWPGLGRWMAQAVLAGDDATILGYVLFLSVSFLLVNLMVDLACARLDPRISLQGSD